MRLFSSSFFFFNDTATTEIYTLSLHDALPICPTRPERQDKVPSSRQGCGAATARRRVSRRHAPAEHPRRDRKSTRLNSSHSQISYAVFCLKKKKKKKKRRQSRSGDTRRVGVAA